MQTLVQTQKIDQLEQEIHELRGEVTTLRAEVEKLTSLVSSLMATKDPPLVQQRPQPPYQLQCMKRPRQQAPRTQIDPIPMKCAELFPRLLGRNLVYTKAPLSVPAILLAGYRADLYCAFHQGAPGYDIEHCFALQKVVQKLVKKNLIPFEDFEFEYAI